MRRRKRRKPSPLVRECRRMYWSLRSWTFSEFCYLVQRLDRLEDALMNELKRLREEVERLGVARSSNSSALMRLSRP